MSAVDSTISTELLIRLEHDLVFTVRAYGVTDCCCIGMDLSALECRDPSGFSVTLSLLSLWDGAV